MHIVLSAVLTLSLPAPGIQREPDLPFDPAEVVRQLSGDPVFDSAAFLLDTNVVYTASAQAQSCASVAFDGECYLVVWTDHRCGFKDDVFGARLSSSGVLLDSAGIPISLEPVNQTRPSVAFNGADFLVVWSDTRTNDYDIHAARVSRDGIVLEPHGFAVYSGAELQQFPSVAAFDTLCLVVWQDSRNGTFDVHATRMSGAQVLDPAGLRLSSGTGNEQYARVCAGANGWLVAWSDTRSGGSDVYAARVRPDGTSPDSTGIIIAGGSHSETGPAVGFDSVWLVAWSDGRSGTYTDIYAARVSADGAVLDSGGFAVSTAGNSQASPAVSGNFEFLVCWTDARRYPDYDIYGARVTRAGAVLEPNGIQVSSASGSQQLPAVAPGDSGWIAAWNDGRGDNSWAIYCARVRTSGTVIDPNGIHASPLLYNQFEPDVGFDGTNYLVVWGDYRAGTNRDIYGTRVTPSGVVLDPQGIALCTEGLWQGVAAVGFDGDNYLVAWSDLRDAGDFNIYGTRVSPAGTMLDPSGITICNYEQIQLYPDITWDGLNWLVVWHDWRNHEYDIYGTRVGPDGTVKDPNSFAISVSDRNQYHPVVATVDTISFVAWDDTRSGSSRIFGTRVTPSGRVLDPDGVAVSSASSYVPAMTADQSNFLVTWDDYRAGSANVYGARVSPDGTVLDPSGLPFCTAVNYQTTSAGVFDGTDHFVAWQDWRNGHDYDIHAARVSTSGTVLETFAVQTGPEEHVSPALGHGPGQQVLLAFCGWTDSVNSRVAHTQRTWAWLHGSGSGVAEDRKLRRTLRAHPVAFPNPFRGSTTIRFGPTTGNRKKVNIFDTGGRLVRSLCLTNGCAAWDGKDDKGNPLPNGIYACRRESGGSPARTCWLTLLR
jgi:hypothetical protein